MKDVTYRQMKSSDYGEIRRLWKATPGIGLSRADGKKHVRLFLNRNRKVSYIALAGGRVVGTVLCGSDARRGYLYHLAVAKTHQARGVGKRLLELCLRNLGKAGIEKVHLFVYKTNTGAIRFYRRTGWKERKELVVFSKMLK